MISKNKIPRRQFIMGIALASTGAAFGIVPSLSKKIKINSKVKNKIIQSFTPNIWVIINTDDTVIITISESEMGQGIRTSLAMILADELDTDWNNVRVTQAKADMSYGNQFTGGSTSIITNYDTLRKAGAVARKMLIQAAASIWGISEVNCRTEFGKIFEIGGSRVLNYGQVALKASELSIPPDGSYSLKQPSEFKIIGNSIPHIDNYDIVSGKAVYGIDVVVEGMKYAVIERPKILGSTLKSYDDTETLKVPGVIKTVRVSSGVAVVANNTWAAIKGREKLKVVWNQSSNSELNSEKISNALRAKIGTLPELPTNTSKFLEVIYEVPYLAHATMEPMNCTADYKPDKLEVWAPTQAPTDAKNSSVNASGLSQDKVTINVTLLGGGFGRRQSNDYVRDAVSVSKAAELPVKVLMTRDDDIRNDYYRTTSVHALKGGIDIGGNITAWIHKGVFAGGGSPFTPPYNLNKSTNLQDSISFFPTGAWRSVTNTQVVFANECFFDELAFLAGKDPYQMRMELASSSRLKAVLQLAATRAGWSTHMEPGRGRGIACFVGYGGYIAHVIEVTISKNGKLKVDRVVAAVDTGIAINPKNIENQVQGACIDALSTALRAAITVKNGQIEQSSYNDYEWLRINEIPKFEIYVVPNGSNPSGMGEVGFPSVSPALCNAIFNATGIRVRELPVSKTSLTSVDDGGMKFDDGQLNIYPNPFNDSFTLEGQIKGLNNTPIEITFSDIFGKPIREVKKIYNGNGKITERINFDKVASGIYFLKLICGKKTYLKRVIKE